MDLDLKKYTWRQIAFLLVLFAVQAGCQKDNPPPQSVPPGKVTLIFPEENAICTTGKVISETESAIDFSWGAGENADSYEVTIKNLVSGETITKATSDLHLEISLLRNTPYSWFILSKSQKIGTTTKSDVFKFFNSGPGVLSYAPFPAEIVSPALGQQVNAPNGTINLDWNGADVDGDLKNYDVYFGTTTTPELLRSEITESQLEVKVEPRSTRYWKVVSRDSKGNTSHTPVYLFRVN